MGESFYYTLYTLKDYRKIGILTGVYYLFSITFFVPNVSIITLLIALQFLFSSSSFFVYLSNRTTGLENYIYNLREQSIWAMFLHCIPSATALLFLMVIVGGVGIITFLHISNLDFIGRWEKALLYFITYRPTIFSLITILTILYLFIISYNFPGKLGAMIHEKSFTKKVLILASTFWDLKFFLNALHLNYFAIYFRWVFISFTLFYFIGEVFFSVLEKMGAIGGLITLLLIDFILIFSLIYTFFSGNEAYYIYKKENEKGY